MTGRLTVLAVSTAGFSDNPVVLRVLLVQLLLLFVFASGSTFHTGPHLWGLMPMMELLPGPFTSGVSSGTLALLPCPLAAMNCRSLTKGLTYYGVGIVTGGRKLYTLGPPFICC